MIKIGILGCGKIAQVRHIPEYAANPDCQLVGFYNPTKSRAEDMAAKYGGLAYDTAEELLANPEIDAVSVCAANYAHAALSIQALKAGKHVLCEKPMATTLADCEAMVAAAKANGRRLLIDQNQRIAPAHRRAKQLLDSGALGRVITFRSVFGHKGPEMWSIDKSANTWFFKKNAAAFGSMADLGIHKIDLMRYLVGGRIVSVYSDMAVLDKKFSDGTPIEVDDNSVEVFRFDNGAMGTVTTSWTHYGEECNSSVLYCEKGILKLYDDPDYSLKIVYADGRHEDLALDRLQTNDDAQQASSGVIDLFVDAVERDVPSVLDAEDVLESMRVVFACLRSAEEGKKILL